MKKIIATLAATTMLLLSTPTPTHAQTAGYPACSKVWVKGHKITKAYQGCTKGGMIHAAVYITCDNGKRLFVSPNDKMWVLAPGKVKKGSAENYSADYWKCVGE